MMHVDISNDGYVIRNISKYKNKGLIFFEGGSLERDNVDWMIKYKKPSINYCGVEYEVLIDKFPSMSQIKVTINEK